MKTKNETTKVKRIYLTYFLQDSDENEKGDKDEKLNSLMLAQSRECSNLQAQKSDKTTLSFRSEESLHEHIKKYGISDDDIVYVGEVRPKNEEVMTSFDLERIREIISRIKYEEYIENIE